MNEQWTNDIRRKLAGFEQPAPDLQWDIIEQAVKAQQAATRPRHATLWPRLTAAAAMAALLAGTAVYLTRDHDKNTVAITTHTGKKGKQNPYPTNGTQQTNDAQTTNGTPAAPSASSSTLSHEPSLVERLVATVERIFTPTATEQDMPLLAAATPTEQIVSTNSQGSVTTEQAASTTEQTNSGSTLMPLPSSKATQQQSPRYTGSATMHQQRTAPRATSNASTFTAKAYVAGQLGSSAASSSPLLFASSIDSNSPEQSQNSPTGYVPTLGNSTEATEHTKHHQPLRLGLSLRYRINDRWSVEAGLSYSHHSTDISEGAGSNSRQTDQQLNFVGIPVAVSYSLWSNRHVNVYASAGGEAERMVSGKRTTQIKADGTQLPAEEEKVKVNRPYFSVNAAVGAEVKIGQTVSVYAEPGVAYHFDNGATLPTIYADKPLNLNMNLGVRFNLK